MHVQREATGTLPDGNEQVACRVLKKPWDSVRLNQGFVTARAQVTLSKGIWDCVIVELPHVFVKADLYVCGKTMLRLMLDPRSDVKRGIQKRRADV